MTETEWLNCAEPRRMMRLLRRTKEGRGIEEHGWFRQPSSGALPRKWRRLLAACCQRLVPLLGGKHEPAGKLIEFAERFADTPPTEDAYQMVDSYTRSGALFTHHDLRLLRGLIVGSPTYATAQLRDIAGHHARSLVPKGEKDSAERAARNAEATAQCALLRDIFGNPFWPVAFEPSWRTETVEALARGIYEGDAFDGMPVLADALEEAGCQNIAILAHCREPGVHVRGCWVVDLILGKD